MRHPRVKVGNAHELRRELSETINFPPKLAFAPKDAAPTTYSLVSEALLQAPAYHPKWLARLNVGGAAVAGSRAPWYARQRIAVPSDFEVALRAALDTAAAARPAPRNMVPLGDVLS